MQKKRHNSQTKEVHGSASELHLFEPYERSSCLSPYERRYFSEPADNSIIPIGSNKLSSYGDDNHQIPITKNLLSSAWAFCLQEYIAVLAGIANAIILLRHSVSIFAVFEFVGIFQTVIDLFSSAIRRPLLNILAENKNNNPLVVGRAMQSAWLLGGVLAIPAIIFWCYAGSFLAFVGVASSLVGYVSAFAFPYVLSIIPSTIYESDMQLLTAMQDKKAVLFFELLSSVSFVLLNYLFVYGFVSSALSGVIGLSIANVVFVFANLAALKIYLFSSSFYQKFKLFTLDVGHLLVELRRLAKLCVGPLIGALVNAPTVILMGIILGWLGEVYVALNGIVSNIYYFVSPITNSILLASSINISENLSKGHQQQAIKYGCYSLVIVGTLSIIFSALMTFFYPPLLALFVQPAALQHISTGFIRLFFMAGTLGSGLEIYHLTCLGNLSAYSDTLLPTLMSAIIMVIIGLPAAYVSSVYFGLLGYYGAMVLSGLLSAVLLTARWFTVSAIVSSANDRSSEDESEQHRISDGSRISRYSFWSASSNDKMEECHVESLSCHLSSTTY